MAEEGLQKTQNELIHIGNPIPFDVDRFLVQLKELMIASYDNNEESIRDIVRNTVETYHPAGKHGSNLKGNTYQRLIKQMSG